MIIYKPRRGAWNRSLPHSPRKGPMLLTFRLLTRSTMRKYISEAIQSVLLCDDCPSKPTQRFISCSCQASTGKKSLLMMVTQEPWLVGQPPPWMLPIVLLERKRVLEGLALIIKCSSSQRYTPLVFRIHWPEWVTWLHPANKGDRKCSPAWGGEVALQVLVQM